MKKTFLLSAPFVLILLSFSVIGTVKPELFFKKGNKFEYEITTLSGEKEISAISIQSVTVKGGFTYIEAKDQRRYPSGKNMLNAYRLRFIHDSLNWCQDVLNLIDIGWDEVGPQWTRKSDSLIYPYSMKVGDTLRFATGSDLYKGKTSGYTNKYITISDRKVIRKEKVLIGTELVEAFRIESAMNQQKVVNMGDGRERKAKAEARMTEWFTPEKGIVRFEVRSLKDTTPTIVVFKPDVK